MWSSRVEVQRLPAITQRFVASGLRALMLGERHNTRRITLAMAALRHKRRQG
jgi:hypothetical protein